MLEGKGGNKLILNGDVLDGSIRVLASLHPEIQI
jgi:hypothetical protein